MMINDILQLIQTELKAPKNQYNKFGNYNYRNCEDILEAIKPIASQHKATVTLDDDIVMIGDRVYVKATATLKVGDESISTNAFAREPASKKGMDDCQITGTASSYARKYALNGLFAIDDTKDSDGLPKFENSKPTPEENARLDKIAYIEQLAQEKCVAISKLEKKYKVKIISALTDEQIENCIAGLENM